MDFVLKLTILKHIKDLSNNKSSPSRGTDSKIKAEREEEDELKRKEINLMWQNFLQAFTLNGFRHIFEKGTIRRVVWLIILLSAIFAVCVSAKKSLTKYFTRPITTTVNMVYRDEIIFPAVTLCNFNFFPHYLINGTIGEKVVSILAPLENFNRTHQEIISQQGPYTANIRDYRSIFTKLKWKRKKIAKKEDSKDKHEDLYFDHNFNFADFVKKHGHKIDHMVKKCHWKAQRCGPENFTSVLTDFGLCYTFNPGTPDHPLLKVHRAGVDFGLRLQLNVQQDQYYGILRDSSGFKVMIHDQDEPPLINELGFAIHPGMHTFCGIRKTKIFNLPAPWETACEDKKTEDQRKYTKSACLMKCRAEFIVGICNCRSFQHEGSAPVCLPHEIRDCVRPAIATFMNESDNCECPVPCEKIRYQPQLSYAQMPAKHYSEALAKLKHIDKDRMRHFLRDNLLELDLYYEEMSTQVIQQVPSYDEESLFGDIGGQIGLFLGASILTVLEIVDLLGRVLVVKFGRVKKPEHIA